MPTILPTRHCFDDALELLAEFGHTDGIELASLTLVHGICRHPDGQPNAGERLAHAWVEVGDLVWNSGILNGQRIRFSVERAEYYQHMRVETTTRYSIWQAAWENQRSGMYGPWRPEYLALCNRRGSAPSPDAVDPVDRRVAPGATRA